MHTPVLEVTELAMVKHGARLLDDIHVSVEAGDLLAVIGPNGAGKSTLINVITGAESHWLGRVMINGQSLQAMPNLERAQQLAVLPQHSHLQFPFTVAEVVALGRTPHSTGTNVDGQIVSEVMALLDITHLQRRHYTDLSGGEKQRTQLARVIAQIWSDNQAVDSTKLLVLDEPCNALDIAHKQQLIRLMKDIAQRNIAVIWVEHDLNLVAQFASRVLALQCGRTLASGAPEQCLTEALVEQLYGAKVSFVRDPQSGNKVMAL